MQATNADPTGSILIVIIGFVIYFLPAIIAIARDHESALGILLLDLFLGWTLVGWVGALVWSVTGGSKPIPSSQKPAPAAKPPAGKSTVDKLKELSELVEQGILTQDEFNQHKQKVLDAL